MRVCICQTKYETFVTAVMNHCTFQHLTNWHSKNLLTFIDMTLLESNVQPNIGTEDKNIQWFE